MSELVEQVARAIYKAVTPPESRWECVEPVYQEGVWRRYARAALSVLEPRIEQLEREVAEAVAAERERCARIALEYAEPLHRRAKEATGGVEYAMNETSALVADSIAAAIRNGEAEQ